VVNVLGKFKDNWYIVLVVLIFIFMFGYGVYNNIRERPSAPVSEEMTAEEVPAQESSPAGEVEEMEEATPSAESSPSGEEAMEATPAAPEELTPQELIER
jgi:cytoskeletal protein RodZ